jgi:hypothetical protein
MKYTQKEYDDLMVRMGEKPEKKKKVAPYAPYRSLWELEYAQHLNERLAAGEIVEWHYEAVRFKWAPKTTYTPDFLLLYPDGSQEFVEVKGYLRESANVKFKTCAERYKGFKWSMQHKVKGIWRILKEIDNRPGRLK